MKFIDFTCCIHKHSQKRNTDLNTVATFHVAEAISSPNSQPIPNDEENSTSISTILILPELFTEYSERLNCNIAKSCDDLALQMKTPATQIVMNEYFDSFKKRLATLLVHSVQV